MDKKGNEIVERLSEAQEVLKNITELEAMMGVEQVLKDNKIRFSIIRKVDNKEVKINYRVRKLTHKDEEELNLARNSKYMELLKAKDDNGNPKYAFDKEIRKELKESRGIDIAKMEQRIEELMQKKEDLLVSLATIKDENTIKKQEEIINGIREEITKVSIGISNYLNFSLENTLETFGNFYYVYLVLEQLQGENWIKVFNKYKEFDQCDDDELIGKAIYCVHRLLGGR